MKNFKIRLLSFVCLLLCLAVTGGIFFSTQTGAGAEEPTVNFVPRVWHPQSRINIHSAAAISNANASQAGATIPMWSSTFTYKNGTYPYTMVGTDPAKSSVTTKIPVEIIPVKLVFPKNVVFDGTKKVNEVVKSPLFQLAKFSSGTTQYGDAIQRAEFWQSVSKTSPNYHVLLDKPQILRAVTINVSSDLGEIVKTKTGKSAALLDTDQFQSRLEVLADTLHIAPTSLPIFLTTDTLLASQHDITQCCVGGFHGATTNSKGQTVTYVYATDDDPGFRADTIFQDINALSHEIAEWLNDPSGANRAPSWTPGSGSVYGCSTQFEVGDPLVGKSFTLNSYHPQDEAFLSWFARQSKSTGINGQYTYLGTFKTFSTSC